MLSFRGSPDRIGTTEESVLHLSLRIENISILRGVTGQGHEGLLIKTNENPYLDPQKEYIPHTWVIKD
jgi:hypothetical protein